MSNLLIRHVPEPVHARLSERAAAAGMSLQQFCLRELERIAGEKSPHEIVAGFRARALELQAQGIEMLSTEEIVATIREMRGPLGGE